MFGTFDVSALPLSLYYRCFWDTLSSDQQAVQLLKLITKAPLVRKPEILYSDIPRFEVDKKLYRKRRTFDQHREASEKRSETIIM